MTAPMSRDRRMRAASVSNNTTGSPPSVSSETTRRAVMVWAAPGVREPIALAPGKLFLITTPASRRCSLAQSSHWTFRSPSSMRRTGFVGSPASKSRMRPRGASAAPCCSSTAIRAPDGDRTTARVFASVKKSSRG
ncbi:hypothetical protein D3C80_1534290 [compost metagenome]